MATAVADYQGRVLKRANPATIQDKFLVGYQGWFTCAGDGEPISPGHHGWRHWVDYPIPDGGRLNLNVWPDVSSYDPSELYPVPGLKLKSGEPARLFSSRNAKTVQRHFHWMAEHGIDGAFLQRFTNECDVEIKGEGLRRLRDEVGERVKEAAEKEGRVFAIMYRIFNVPANRLFQVLERDWVHLMNTKCILDSPNYLKENGKPVIGIWGFGFSTQHTPSLLRDVAQFFRTNTPGSAYLFAGVPGNWRTCDGDAALSNPVDVITPKIWLETFDAISPWTIRQYRNELEAKRWGEGRMKDDLAAVKGWNEEYVNIVLERKVDYVPVIFPGESGYHSNKGKWAFNDIKRQGGRFLWQQIVNAKKLGGVGIVYGGTWDEYDDGRAFMPIVEYKNQLPQHNNYMFMALDEDGYDIPSDWYMRICGFAAEALREERRVFESFPLNELLDYWATRPKYEEGLFSPGAIVKGGVGDGAAAHSSSETGTTSGVAGGAAEHRGADRTLAPDLMSRIPRTQFQISATPNNALVQTEEGKLVLRKPYQEDVGSGTAQQIEHVRGEVVERTKRMHTEVAECAQRMESEISELFKQLTKEVSMSTKDAGRNLNIGALKASTETQLPKVGDDGGRSSDESSILPPRIRSKALPPNLSNAQWIWTGAYFQLPGGRPFRKTFSLNRPVDSVTIDITSDTYDTLYVNGKIVGCTNKGGGSKRARRYTIRFDATKHLVIAAWVGQPTELKHSGMVLAGVAWNSYEENPFSFPFNTDASWKTQSIPIAPEEFKQALHSGYDESGWEQVNVEGPFDSAQQAGKVIKPTKESPVGDRLAGTPGNEAAPDTDPAHAW